MWLVILSEILSVFCPILWWNEVCRHMYWWTWCTTLLILVLVFKHPPHLLHIRKRFLRLHLLLSAWINRCKLLVLCSVLLYTKCKNVLLCYKTHFETSAFCHESVYISPFCSNYSTVYRILKHHFGILYCKNKIRSFNFLFVCK